MIRVVQYGVGPIGLASVRAILGREGLTLSGVVDIDPNKLGRDVADLLELGTPTGVVVGRSEDVLASTDADVAVHTTASALATIGPQLEELIDAGLHIVSSSEELFYPWLRSPDLARAIDGRAREASVVVLGTGVNPGFILDTLPVFLTSVSGHVRSIQAERVVDVRTRRLPLQRKLGVGLTPADFEEGVKAGRLGHRGTPQSVAFIADALGWSLDDVTEEIEPVIADERVEVGGRAVESGQVLGVSQTVRGTADGRDLIRLILQMYAGAPNPRDRLVIDGDPPIRTELEGGIAGDSATVAALVNSIPALLELDPGLRTMKDVPLSRWSAVPFRPH